MSKPFEQRIIEVLEEHMFNDQRRCECGVSVRGTDYESPAELAREHLAMSLMPLIEEAMAVGWEEAHKDIRMIPCWYADKDHHGFDLWEDKDGVSQEQGARIEVMKILENNPFKTKEHNDRP